MKGPSGAAQEKEGEASGEAAACKMGLLRAQIPQKEKTPVVIGLQEPFGAN